MSTPLNAKTEFAEFTRNMPTQIARLRNGAAFSYRYYQNPQPESNVTLLFLAGGSGLADGAFMIFRRFYAKYNLLTFNYPPAFSTNAGLADALNELLAQLGVTNVYLVGQSYGGLFAQVMAKRHPEAIKGLILSGTCSLYNDLNYEGTASVVRFLSPKRRKRYLWFDRHAPVKLLIWFMKIMLKKHAPDKVSARYLADVVDQIKGSITNEYWYHMDLLLADLVGEFGTHKPVDFASFENEVLLFFSEEDTLFGEALDDALIRLMPSPSVVKDFAGGHLAMFLDFDDYVHHIDTFIKQRNQ